MKKDKTLHNLISKKEQRSSLRNKATRAEVELWKYLQRKQLHGRKFRRQHSIGPYILDFYCPSESLGIELDGARHYTPIGLRSDLIRTQYLNRNGIRIIRFENKEVFQQIDNVLERIKNNFINPPLLAGGGGGSRKK